MHTHKHILTYTQTHILTYTQHTQTELGTCGFFMEVIFKEEDYLQNRKNASAQLFVTCTQDTYLLTQDLIYTHRHWQKCPDFYRSTDCGTMVIYGFHGRNRSRTKETRGTRKDKTAILGKISPIFCLLILVINSKHGTHLLFFHLHVYGFCLFSAYVLLIFHLFSA